MQGQGKKVGKSNEGFDKAVKDWEKQVTVPGTYVLQYSAVVAASGDRITEYRVEG